MYWRLGLVCLTAGLIGCMQTENSSSLDKTTWSGDDSPFGKAKKVMAQNCAQCHPYSTQSEDKLASDGLIAKGNAEGSKIYQRLNGIGGALMPLTGALSSGDITTIKDWINQIQ